MRTFKIPILDEMVLLATIIGIAITSYLCVIIIPMDIQDHMYEKLLEITPKMTWNDIQAMVPEIPWYLQVVIVFITSQVIVHLIRVGLSR